MAEIANSDSPHPFSSTPIRPYLAPSGLGLGFPPSSPLFNYNHNLNHDQDNNQLRPRPPLHNHHSPPARTRAPAPARDESPSSSVLLPDSHSASSPTLQSTSSPSSSSSPDFATESEDDLSEASDGATHWPAHDLDHHQLNLFNVPRDVDMDDDAESDLFVNDEQDDISPQPSTPPRLSPSQRNRYRSRSPLFLDDFPSSPSVDSSISPGPRRPVRPRDELVEMDFQQVGRGQGADRNLRSRSRPQPSQVIDLTGDDDDDDGIEVPAVRPPPPPAASASASASRNLPNNSQNPRRRNSQQQRNDPPTLARTDASYMGAADIIDLISDDDDDDGQDVNPPLRRNVGGNVGGNRGGNMGHGARNAGARNAGARHAAAGNPGARIARPLDLTFPPAPPPQGQPPDPRGANIYGNILQPFDRLFGPVFQMLGQRQPPPAQEADDDIVMMGQRPLMGLHRRMPQPAVAVAANFGPVDLDYNNPPFPPPPAAANAKPAHQPPSVAREGFTRDTGEDVEAICPSCEEELAYDPDEEDVPGTPAKRPSRSKKDKAEHHFWAVKGCGHVYCRRCFENRRPTGKSPVTVGFRSDPSGAKNKILCAVGNCNSDVGPKSAWVGIYL
ncbi:hypothetical protein F4778DRAFT_786889 [Xylariomycetidae sp. FL2044]|nr:hypothetical protein F4778DRAFT_786889 [Xylariomycetidae sp. FL2044]